MADRVDVRTCPQTPARWAALHQRQAGRHAVAQADRPAGLRQRRAVLGGLRPGRNLHHPLGRRPLGLRVLLEGRPGGRRRHADDRRVLPAERARLPLRRRRLRGRDDQHRLVRGADRGQRPARRLRPHRGGLGVLRRAERDLGAALHQRPRGGRGHGSGAPADVGEPSWHPRVGQHLRRSRPTASWSRSSGWSSGGCLRHAFGHLPPVDSAKFTINPDPSFVARAGQLRRRVPHPADLLLRLCRPDRRRGDQQRRTGLPQAQEQERRDHPAAHGRPLGHDADRHHHPGQPGPPAVRRPRRRHEPADLPRHRPGEGRLGCRQAAERHGLRPADGHRPAGPLGLLQLHAGVLLHHRRHRDHPDPGGQHGVQRLPGAGLDPGPGRLPAPPAAHPRRPAGLQQRHRDPRRRGDRADHRLQRPADPADPALHRRGVRLVHHQPDRHDPALEPAPEVASRTASCGPG